MTGELPEGLIEGIRKFNSGKFYEAHDILEDVWFEVRDDSRDFYQGLIHLAVGFHHLKDKNNPSGALLQFKKSVGKLSKFEPSFKGIDLKNLVVKIEKVIEEIENTPIRNLKNISSIKIHIDK